MRVAAGILVRLRVLTAFLLNVNTKVVQGTDQRHLHLAFPKRALGEDYALRVPGLRGGATSREVYPPIQTVLRLD